MNVIHNFRENPVPIALHFLSEARNGESYCRANCLRRDFWQTSVPMTATRDGAGAMVLRTKGVDCGGIDTCRRV